MHVIDHLRDYAQDLEKCKVVQIFHVQEARNHEDCKKKNDNYVR